jgi:hypothetical protein
VFGRFLLYQLRNNNYSTVKLNQKKEKHLLLRETFQKTIDELAKTKVQLQIKFAGSSRSMQIILGFLQQLPLKNHICRRNVNHQIRFNFPFGNFPWRLFFLQYSWNRIDSNHVFEIDLSPVLAQFFLSSVLLSPLNRMLPVYCGLDRISCSFLWSTQSNSLGNDAK